MTTNNRFFFSFYFYFRAGFFFTQNNILHERVSVGNFVYLLRSYFSLIYKVKYTQFVCAKHGECRPPPQDVQQLFEAWEKVKVVQPLLKCPLLRRDVSDDALASKPQAALRRHETAARRPQLCRLHAR